MQISTKGQRLIGLLLIAISIISVTMLDGTIALLFVVMGIWFVMSEEKLITLPIIKIDNKEENEKC